MTDQSTSTSTPGESIQDTGTAALDAVVGAAVAAAPAMAAASPETRRGWLDAAADALGERAEELVALARGESHLPEARLNGELARTQAQLRLLGAEIAQGRVLHAVIDHADAEWKSVARPDLRRVLVPIGPVAVYAASNFPFAFSVAGGDTAAALAAGCPVVVKAHPGHPRLSEAVAQTVVQALQAAGAPAGALGLVHGFEAGIQLIQHPDIRAGAFTGSLPAGRALFDLAAARPEPIPFYGELGSVNPVFVTPGAAQGRGEDIAAGYAASLALGVGQFCTNPGILLAPRGSALVEATAQALREVAPAPMLNERIAQGYADGLQRLRGIDGVRVVVDGGSGAEPAPSLLAVDAAVFADVEELSQECFGPVSLVVEYDTEEQALAIADGLEGQLTATVHGDADEPVSAALLATLAGKAGRVLWNDWPTGVAVTYAMQHGGPYPATTTTHTSVGTAAIERFLRPVSYQGLPDTLLPPSLQDANPWRLPRRVDGSWVDVDQPA